MKKKIPTEEELTKLGVKSWGIWEKEKSIFDWSYSDTLYFRRRNRSNR